MPAKRTRATSRVYANRRRVSGMGKGGAVLMERIRTEHEEQREFVSWFRQTYRPVRIFAVPNGEQRSKTTGARLKVEGVSAGVPDLCIPAWNVWIEMKRAKGGVVSDKQKDWHEYLRSVGHTVLVCHGAADARAQVEALRL